MSDPGKSKKIKKTEEDAGASTESTGSDRVREIIQRPLEVEAKGETYLMNRKVRKAFIFDHSTFAKELELGDRPGTEKDVARLKEILPIFNFTVEVYQNLNKIDLLSTIKKIRSDKYDDCDCLAIFVLSHGKEHSIAAYDDYYYTDELWNPFSCVDCPTMAGKPKLFFINACRGLARDANPVEFIKALHPVDGFDRDNTGSQDFHLVYNIPNMADILIAYSTYDGYVSHRADEGSWFIQVLCEVLEDDNYRIMEIKQMLTRVANKVALMISNIRTKQVPVVVSTLIRDLYLS